MRPEGSAKQLEVRRFIGGRLLREGTGVREAAHLGGADGDASTFDPWRDLANSPTACSACAREDQRRSIPGPGILLLPPRLALIQHTGGLEHNQVMNFQVMSP